jgi:CubicO group peptidase (beta-lactamase class C family)
MRRTIAASSVAFRGLKSSVQAEAIPRTATDRVHSGQSRTLIAAVLIATLAVSACAAATPSPIQSDKIARVEDGLTTPVAIRGRPLEKMTLAGRMRYYHVPAVSIAFFDPSGILWARAYGATTSTLFQAGSISKPVFAVGVMRLVQEHRMNLDENVNDRLRSWKVPENALTAKRAVTLRELLSHTAGMNVHGFNGYERGHPVPTLEEVLDGRPPANSQPIRVVSPPGEQYRYSGGGYVVAQQLLLDTVREPFATYMHDAVLAPLGMTNSSFQEPLPRALWSHAAVGYDQDGRPYPGKWHVYPEQAAGGLWTTPTDLAKFEIGMQRALDGDPGTILSAADARAMLTPVKDTTGLGFVTATAGGEPGFGHTGDDAGFEALMVMHRGGQGVAIMTDSDNGTELIDEIMDSIGAAYGWSDYRTKQKPLYSMPPSQYARFVGMYRIPSHILAPQALILQVVRRGNALYALLPGSTERLYPESPMTFFVLDQDIDFRFTSGPSGRISGAIIDPPGAQIQKIKG